TPTTRPGWRIAVTLTPWPWSSASLPRGRARPNATTTPSGLRISASLGCRLSRGAGVALADEGAPIERVWMFRPDRHLGRTERVGAGLASKNPSIEILHQRTGLLVGDGPQAHQQGLGPSQHERALQAEDTLARADLAQPGLARREHD